jgi:hypothetical protein
MKGVFHCLSIVCVLTILPVAAMRMALQNRTFFSSNKQYRLETIPDWTGVPSGSNPTVTKGVLSKQDTDGNYSTVWSVTLVNACGPGTALVPNNGRYVVTLSDFFPKPEENFLVVYGDGGRLIRRWTLNELLTDTHIARPPVWDHRDDNGRLIGLSDGGDLNRPGIQKPHIDESNNRLFFVLRAREGPGDYQVKEVTVDLSTGRIL